MIFDLLAPPQGPRRQGPKKCTVACAIDVSIHTPNLVEFGKKSSMSPQPPRYPQVPPLGHDPGYGMKIPSDMFYIFYL